MATVSLKKIIGKGYTEFWRDKTHRYTVIKGSRASKKSKTVALWIIYHMMKYPLSNTLVIRRVFNTLKDSCWTDLKWATNRLGVENLWKFNRSPLQATYIPTGQVILFRGLDDPMSITSIAVENGYLNFAWLNFLTKKNHFNSWKLLTSNVEDNHERSLILFNKMQKRDDFIK